MMPRLTKEQMAQAACVAVEIRKMMASEAELMIEQTGQPRLVAYGALVTAIECAVLGGMTPDQFSAMVDDVVGFACGGKAEPTALRKAMGLDQG